MMTPQENRRLITQRQNLLRELQEIERDLRKANVPAFVDAAQILSDLKRREESARTKKVLVESRDVHVTFCGVTYETSRKL